MLLRSRRRRSFALLASMFKVPKGSRAAKSSQSAYREYAEQIQRAFRKGLAGEKTTASDVNGSCRAIFNGQ
jgi:shikimate kinase